MNRTKRNGFLFSEVQSKTLRTMCLPLSLKRLITAIPILKKELQGVKTGIQVIFSMQKMDVAVLA